MACQPPHKEKGESMRGGREEVTGLKTGKRGAERGPNNDE